MRKFRTITPIRPNDYCFLLRTYCSLIFLFLISISLKAQDGDSTNIEVTETSVDTTAIEELPNYFDKINVDEQDTIELRQVPARVMDSLKNNGAFWYANAKLERKKEEREVRRTTPGWVRTLVWTIIVGLFLAGLIWYLASSNVLIFTKRRKQIGVIKEDQEIPEDIFSINYQREIEKAIGAENFRLAIRLMFLRLLRNLSNKNIIHYRQEKTNFDYLSQLISSGSYRDFFRLTRNYEYAWYGKFDVSAEAFGAIKNDFENFERQIK